VLGLSRRRWRPPNSSWASTSTAPALRKRLCPYFREAHRLQPDNWTYRRQAWSFVNRAQGPSAEYESDFLSDIRKIGAENYYAPLQM